MAFSPTRASTAVGLCVFLGSLCALANPQEKSPQETPPREQLAQNKDRTLKHAEVTVTEAPPEGDPDSNRFMAIPFASYGPETGWLGGAAMLYLFHLDSERNSQVATSVRYTEKKQLLLRLKPELWWGNNHVKLDVEYDRFPDYVWGVGRGTAASAEEKFLPVSTRLELDLDRRVWRRWFVGMRSEQVFTSIKESESDGFIANGATGATGGFLNGLGLQALWDDRDNANATTQGSYLKVGALHFNKAWGSDFSFTRYLLDARHFFDLGGEQVIGVQAISLYVAGNAPFYELPRIGGKKVMRGYYNGRYRDQTMAAFQVEYRRPLFWRLGMVAFGGVADVADSPGDLSFGAPKWSAGGGIRIAISRKSRLNARLDIGYAEGETSTYLNFGEAF
ncbi:MAG: BamA/TamA family outer membrane protein [Bradymonadia bacterium]